MKKLYTNLLHPVNVNPDHNPEYGAGAGTSEASQCAAVLAVNALLDAYEANQEPGHDLTDKEQKVMYAEPDMATDCDGCLLQSLSEPVAGWFWCRRLGTWGKRYGCPVPKGLPPMSPADQESLVFAMAAAGLGGTETSADAEMCGDMVARWPSTGAMARPVTGSPAAAATPAGGVAGV